MPDGYHERLIVTAASEEFAPSMAALLGSLNLNWPGHPPVLTYDIGLAPSSVRLFEAHGITVRKVPAFCPHWRHHFTWKIWCLNDAPARDVLWMDSGLVVLRPVDEMFESIERLGYFFTANHELLDWEASDEACFGCGVPLEFRVGRPTLAGTLMGFRKEGETLRVLEEALAVAMTEKNIAATEVTHRHDQAIVSLLAYKHLGSVVIADRLLYLGHPSPDEVPGQKVWVHRRSIAPGDLARLASHITGAGGPYVPRPPHPRPRLVAYQHLYKVHWHFGRRDRDEARRQLLAAFTIDPSLRNEAGDLAARLRGDARRLESFSRDRAVSEGFLEWVSQQLEGMDPAVAKAVADVLAAHGSAR